MSILVQRRLASSIASTSYPPVPNPSFLDLIRNGFPLGNMEKKMLGFLDRSKEIYGDIYTCKIPLGPQGVVLFNPYDAEKVYQAAGKWPIRPGFLALEEFRSHRPLYQNSAGLLPSQGQAWFDFRSKVQGALLKPKIIKTYHARVDQVAEDFIENVFQHTLDNGRATPNMIEHFYQWGLESTGILAFDRRLGVINKSFDSEAQEVVDIVQRIFILTQTLEINLIWKIIGRLFPPYREVLVLFERLEEIAKKYTNEKIALIDKTESSTSSGSVIETLYRAGCDLNILTTLAIDMIMAGVDTAANQISFVFYYLARFPDTQEKLYNEIIGLDISDPNATERAVYLRACIKEVLRLRPTAFANTRIVEIPIELKGLKINKGDMVTFCHMNMSHDARFVDEPEEFRPERHIRGHPQYEKMHPFMSLPFGHGPRVCVGKRFANMELYLLINRILTKYRLEWTQEPLEIKTPFLMKPAGAIPVRFIPRNLDGKQGSHSELPI